MPDRTCGFATVFHQCLSIVMVAFAAADVTLDYTEPSWKQCQTYVAPSLIDGFGLGVFAARRFEPGDYIEFSPLYIRAAEKSLIARLSSTALASYYVTVNSVGSMVPLGSAMVYNSHPDPNAKFDGGGVFPSKSNPNGGVVFSIKAIKGITPGEEILLDYGKTWFTKMSLRQKVPNLSSASRAATVKTDVDKYCSKLVSGVGQEMLARLTGHVNSNLLQRLMPQVPPDDHGLGQVIARHSVGPGDVIELAPALVLPAEHFIASLLAPLLIEWSHLSALQREQLLHERQRNKLLLQVLQKGQNGQLLRRDAWNTSNVALLPLGSVALVRRVGHDHTLANCELVLQDSVQSKGEMTAVDVALVATKQVAEGELLSVNLPRAGDARENVVLLAHLLETGQPMPAMLEGLPRLRDHVGRTRVEGQRQQKVPEPIGKHEL